MIGGEPVTTEIPPELEEERDQPKLRPAELFFLFKDLHSKLDNILRSKVFPGVKGFSQFGFTNLHLQSQSQVVEAVVEHLKFIFSHLDQLKEYFKRLREISEGPEELARLITPLTVLIMDCLKVGLLGMESFFSWTGFRAPEHEELVRKSFQEIVGRLMEVGLDGDLNFLVTESLSYLSSFSVCSLTSELAAVHLTMMSTVAHFKVRQYSDCSMLMVGTFLPSFHIVNGN